MENLKQKWLKSFIIGLVVTITGSTVIGTIASSIIDVASGTPIQSVVKDLAVDSVKSKALDVLYGDSDNSSSVGYMFNKNKYKYVSDKKSGPIGYIAPGWDVECYRIETDAFIGNRKYNKANGVNVKWNMVNATDFEIGNFKKNVAYSESYVAYDSSSFKLVLGEIKRSKLNGFILVYDEYYNEYDLIQYKKGKETGYKIDYIDGEIYYLNKDKKVAIYNEDKGSFKKLDGLFKKEPSVEITKHEDGYTFDFGDYEYRVYNDKDYLEYNSDVIDFKGNAFSFECEYNYKKDESVTYTFETMHRLKVECTDGTIGEVLVVDDADMSIEAITAKSISIALIKIGAHATVDALVEGNLDLLDKTVKLFTGESISDMINCELDKIIDDAFDENSDLNKNIKEFNEIVDTITDFSDDRSLEEKLKEGKIDEQEIKTETDENGEDTLILPSGVKVKIER